MDRAQTTVDFVVGIAIFLLIVGMIFTFVPLSFEPIRSDWGDEAMASDNIASDLTGRLLAEDTSHPSVLNDSCVVGFFNTSVGVPAGCSYDTDSSDLQQALSLPSGTKVNITIEDGGTISSISDTDLAAGEAPPDRVTEVVATRSVLVDGKQQRLVVRVW